MKAGRKCLPCYCSNKELDILTQEQNLKLKELFASFK
jgi:hypothetical protein